MNLFFAAITVLSVHAATAQTTILPTTVETTLPTTAEITVPTIAETTAAQTEQTTIETTDETTIAATDETTIPTIDGTDDVTADIDNNSDQEVDTNGNSPNINININVGCCNKNNKKENKTVKLPEGYELAPKLGKAYKVIKNPLPWNKARKACISDGGHLVAPNSEAEDKYVEKLRTSNSAGRVWIGFSDIIKEGEFYTVLDEPLKSRSYKVWGSINPNNGGKKKDEDCVELTNNKWNDLNCDLHLNYICEIRV